MMRDKSAMPILSSSVAFCL